jgi:hypothetical protein
MQGAGVAELELLAEELYGKVFSTDIINMETGEVLFDCNEEITQDLDKLLEVGIDEFEVLFIDPLTAGPYLRDTLKADKITTPTRRSSRSTAVCARVIRRRSSRRRTTSTTCSSIRAATTSRRSAASS